jgi:hypothetical protein
MIDDVKKAAENPTEALFFERNTGGKIPHKFSPAEKQANWLPNFGRVFNAGSRSQTAHEFREELEKQGTTVKAISAASTTPNSAPAQMNIDSRHEKNEQKPTYGPCF